MELLPPEAIQYFNVKAQHVLELLKEDSDLGALIRLIQTIALLWIPVTRASDG
jgi:hypothetical protein